MHSIRLRHSWTIELSTANRQEQRQGELQAHLENWLAPLRIHARRRFHRPARLEPSSRLALRIESMVPPDRVTLISIRGETPGRAFDAQLDDRSKGQALFRILEPLANFNELHLEWTEWPDAIRWEAAVSLQIESAGGL